MSILREGRHAEIMCRAWLIAKGYVVFQPDWIGKNNGEYVIVEVKHQEKFVPPPFYGHGLPRWQIKTRLDFQKETGIKAIMAILDKGIVLIWLNLVFHF